MNKIIVIGNDKVGKSSLIERICKGTFSEEYKQTSHLTITEHRSYSFYDYPTSELYGILEDACFAVILFDVNDDESLNDTNFWVKYVDENDIPYIVCGNKDDMNSYKSYFTISVKQSINLDKLVNIINEKVIKKIH
jgi:GTPase SAR1 family protein